MKGFLLSILSLVICLLPYGALAEEVLTYSGSSTIGTGVLLAGAKDAFERRTGIKLTVHQPGSGKGIKALLEGQADVAGVSRPLKGAEKKQKLLAHVVGYDAIGVFVHRSNPVQNLTKEQLKGIFTGRIRNWRQVGGRNAPITPNTEILGSKRATVLMFQKLVMDEAPYGQGFKEIDLPRDQLVHLARDRTGICTVSIGLLSAVSPEVRRQVKLVKVNGIEPSAENIISGRYIIARPLLLVTRGLPQGKTERFIDFMLSREGQAIVGKNFVPARR